MAIGYQVMKFVRVDFDKEWSSAPATSGYSQVRYTAGKSGGTLAVVVEGATRVLSTYRFKVGPMQAVFVLDQVIHVPAHCYAEEKGVTVKCDG